MTQIAVIGSINMDLVSKVEKMPQIGETILGKGFMQIPGGKGANQAVAMARLGSKVAMVGRVGDDEFGKTLTRELEKDNVDIEAVEVDRDNPTGIAAITVDESANNCIVVNAGANFSVTREFIDSNLEKIKAADIVVLQLEIPQDAVEYSLEVSKKLGKYTILNPAPARRLDKDLIKNVDLLIPNETELELISGMKTGSEEEVVAAAKSLIQEGVKEIIVTLGEKGCVHVKEDFCKRHEAIKVDAIDTTAAGDSFIAGVASTLARGKSIDEAIDFAVRVAAVTVTREGAQSSLPRIDEI